MFIIKNKVRDYRKELQITQADFAESLGISRETLGKIEREKVADLSIIRAYEIAMKLNKPVNDVFIVEDVKE